MSTSSVKRRHPSPLFLLFFAEMWERFSYYGMRALLVFYMIKGFLSLEDSSAYAIYGAYGALVYAMPFIGGMLADRLLGKRRAVVIGGLLMAAGHLLMTVENSLVFFTALAFIIAGNGFFKPNISSMVGDLYDKYPEVAEKRDGGFTLFYMGVNLGAAMSPLLCGYVGETYGWHYGFGLATAGMLLGVAIFTIPVTITRVLILVGSIGTAISMLFLQDSGYQLAVNGFVAMALLVAGVYSFITLREGGLPDDLGAPPRPEALREKVGGIRKDILVYIGILVAIPILALMVQRNALVGWILVIFGGAAFAWLLVEAIRSPKLERERLFVVIVLLFFSMLFWSFFEQAGSSVNNFTDRNVDRVFEDRTLSDADVGTTIEIKLNQEQLGYTHNGEVFTITTLSEAREANKDVVKWKVEKSHVGMNVEGAEMPASLFQAVNPIFILMFGLVFTWLWGFLAARKLEPSTPVKFSLGILQLGLGFAVLWYGAKHADARGMVGLAWLLLGYLLHTTGELCLSPVGLSMVTKLSPTKIVSTVIGAWFLATAFSGYLAGVIATFTGVEHAEGAEKIIPAPVETVGLYGDVFGPIAIACVVSAALLLMLSPLLRRWMHEGE